MSKKSLLGGVAAFSFVGGVLGVSTSASNHGFGIAPGHVSQLLDAAWTWVAVGLLPCLVARRWRSSAALSGATLWAAVICYYIADLHYGVYDGLATMNPAAAPGTDWLNLISDVLGYSLFAAIAASGLALLATIVRRGGTVGLLAQLVVPVFAVWGSWTRVHDAYIVSDTTPALIETNRAVTVVSVTIVVILIGLSLRRRLRSGGRQALRGASIPTLTDRY